MEIANLVKYFLNVFKIHIPNAFEKVFGICIRIFYDNYTPKVFGILQKNYLKYFWNCISYPYLY